MKLIYGVVAICDGEEATGFARIKPTLEDARAFIDDEIARAQRLAKHMPIESFRAVQYLVVQLPVLHVQESDPSIWPKQVEERER